ncbi:hypothetical protein [Proteus mirabilis]|uniref:hypothetical protein n=1 Tax=Proteus mirabilis TaxID=584 RepID=UPI0034D45904
MVVHRNSRKREYKITPRSVGQILLTLIQNVRDLALNLRVENCQLKDTSSAMMIGTMQNDPMFSFMLAVHTAAGSEAYKTVVGAAGNHVDCENPLNWIKLTQQAIKGGKV